MANLLPGLLVIFLCHFVESRDVTCIHQKCPANSGCDLYVNSAGLQGSCRLNGLQWHSEHPEVPTCLGISLVPGSHCFCPRQFCVNYVLHHYNANHTAASNSSVAPSVAPSVASTVAPLSCHGHYCVGNQVCLLTTNPKIPTTCGLRNDHPTCSTHQNPDVVCACDTQSCINNFQRLHRKDLHVNCGGEHCHIHLNSVCIVAYNNNYHIFGKSSRISLSCVKANTAVEKANLPNRCTSTPSHRGQKCFCESQICVNSYGNVEPMDDHVDCGNISCHVHSGMYCIVSRTGRLYHYRHQVSSVEQHCAHNNTESHKYPTCTTSLRKGQTCHCATQSCVNSFTIRTTSAPTTSTAKTTIKTTKSVQTTKMSTTRTTLQTLHTKDSHVNCGGTDCQIYLNNVCIVANNNSHHIFGKSSHISLSCVKANTAGEKANLPKRCTSTPYHRGQTCFCESQLCVNSYGNAEPMDDHVHCGNTSCHVHRGKYCIVSRTGRLYHYRHQVSSAEQHCAHNNTESHRYPTCTTSLRIGQTCHCATQSCVNNFSIRTTSAPTTPTAKTTTKTTTTKTATTKTTAKTTTSVPTTMMTTTITTTLPTTITTLPTTPKDYPECNGHNCSKYAEYCHLFMLGDTLKGSCVPFKVALECNTFEDLNGPGCTCSTTACFQEMVIGYNQHSTTNTPIITTQEVGFNCFGETCFPSKGFCHISQHNGGLHGNCVNSNDWPMCRSFADLTEYGCYCSTATCTETAVKMFALEVMFMTASSKSTSEATTTMQTTIQVKTTSSKTVTCFDKPGVDCDILNTTNICANLLAARQYCAAYCDLCNLDGVPIVFG